MSISVYAHITETTEISVALQEVEAVKCATLEAGGLAVFIHSRAKLLEIASQLKNAAQKWDEEEQ